MGPGVYELRGVTIKYEMTRTLCDPADHAPENRKSEGAERRKVDRKEAGGRCDLNDVLSTGFSKVMARWPVRPQRGPKVCEIVDPPKPHVKASRRDGRVIPISLRFQRVKGHRTDP